MSVENDLERACELLILWSYLDEYPDVDQMVTLRQKTLAFMKGRTLPRSLREALRRDPPS